MYSLQADLISSHRTFVSKVEVVELSGTLSGRGHSLVFLLFNDALEVCKKRSRGFNANKSPNSTALNSLQAVGGGGSAVGGTCAGSNHSKQPYKHVKLMPLNTIRHIVDIRNTLRTFALGCRLSKENKDKYYYFSLEEMEMDKDLYLPLLAKQMAESACKADTVT